MGVTRVSVNLPDDAVDVLRELAGRRNTTMTEVLRQAISIEKFLQDQVDDGSKLLIEDNERNVKEVLLR